jgi:hypothetical protein
MMTGHARKSRFNLHLHRHVVIRYQRRKAMSSIVDVLEEMLNKSLIDRTL